MKAQSLLAVGNKVLIRTVTNYFTGEIVEVEGSEVTLKEAAWIADTGRFHQALKTGELNEIEPMPDGMVTIGRGAIIDICTWSNDLPRKQK